MVFSTDNCVLIKVLRQEKWYGANSPDLNPVDYQIWGKLQERVYHSWNHDEPAEIMPDRRVGTFPLGTCR